LQAFDYKNLNNLLTMAEPNKYFVDFIDSKDGVEEVARIADINRQTLRQAYLGRNGVSAKVIKSMTEAFEDFQPEKVYGSLRPRQSLVQYATEEPGENQVALLKARIKQLEETVEEKKRTIKEREDMIRFLAVTHPELKETVMSLNFTKGNSKDRLQNRGPIRRKEFTFVPSWQSDQPEPEA
jgi:DNA-binding transcriptional MerR regulator